MENGLRIRTKARTPAEHGGGRGGIVDEDGGQDHNVEAWARPEEVEEPLSPFGRMYHTEGLNVRIMVVFGFAVALDFDVLKECMEKTFARHPRLSSKLVLDAKKGEKQRWVRVKVNLDDHILVPDLNPDMENPDRFIEDYTSDLFNTPFDLSKPLWEFHVLNIKTSNAESVGIWKVHHSLGDGMSLVALTLACSRKSSNPEELPSITPQKKKVSKSADESLYRYLIAIWLILKLIWNTVIGSSQILATSYILKDTKTPIISEKVDKSSRKKIVHKVVSLDDIKLVKNEMNTTVNDVVVGITSAALSRYLHMRYDEDSISSQMDLLGKKIRLRASVAMNIREAVGIQDIADMMDKGSKCRWGNVSSVILVPFRVSLEKDPLEYIRHAKLVIDQKKLSLEAQLSYYLCVFVSKLLGVEYAQGLMYRAASNTTLTFSNVVGPAEEIDFCGHRVTYLAPTAGTAGGHPPGLVIHFMSCVNKMAIALCVNQDLIPDPHKLLDELEESLRLMKDAVLQRKLNKKSD